MNIANIKTEFPLFRTYPELVYLDSAATSQKPESVIASIVKFYTEENANVHRGIYRLSELATEHYEASRHKIAEFLGVRPSEIIFTSGTTAAANTLAAGLEAKLNPGDVVLTSVAEHHSNFLPFLRAVQSRNAKLELLNLKPDLSFDYEQLVQKLTQLGSNLKLLVLGASNNVLGEKLDIEKIVTATRAAAPQALIVMDIAQQVGHSDLDLSKLDLDFAYFSGHKMFASTGIGVLWGKSSLLESLEPWQLGGGMISSVTLIERDYQEIPARFEAGTPDIAGAISMAAAIDFITAIGLDVIEKKLSELTSVALNSLQTIAELEFYGPIAARAELISFNLKGIHPHDIAQILDEKNIALRAGQHCNQMLHRDVIKTGSSLRASWHIYNEPADFEKLTEALKHAYTILKK